MKRAEAARIVEDIEARYPECKVYILTGRNGDAVCVHMEIDQERSLEVYDAERVLAGS